MYVNLRIVVHIHVHIHALMLELTNSCVALLMLFQAREMFVLWNHKYAKK